MPTTIETLLASAREHWDDAKQIGELGRELHYRNRLDHAQRCLERSRALDPTDGDVWAHLAYCQLRSLERDEGMDTLRRGVDATGSDYLRATLMHFTRDEEEKTKLREAIGDAEVPAVRMSLLAHDVYGDDGRTVLDEMRTLLHANPSDEDVREHWLWTLMGARHQGIVDDDVLRDEGLPLAEVAIVKRPRAVFGYWMKAQLLIGLKDWDGVLKTAIRALEQFPDEETQMYFRALALIELGQEEEAMHWLARAIGAKPSYAGARVRLGRLYENQGKLELAEQIFREIPAANPGYAMGPISLALFLARQERWGEAEQVFLEAWPRMPEMFQAAVRGNPDAKALLEREAVKAVVGEADAQPA